MMVIMRMMVMVLVKSYDSAKSLRSEFAKDQLSTTVQILNHFSMNAKFYCHEILSLLSFCI